MNDLTLFDIFIIIGDCGCGKTFLLNKLFNLNLIENNSSTHVTQSILTINVLIENRSVLVVDTPGFDLGDKNMINLNDYIGKNIVLIYLSNNYRYETYCQKIANKLNINFLDINIYNCFYMKNEKINEYNKIYSDYVENHFKMFKIKSNIYEYDKEIIINKNINNQLKNITPEIQKIHQPRLQQHVKFDKYQILNTFNVEVIKKYRIIGDNYLKLCCSIQNEFTNTNHDTINTNSFLKKYTCLSIPRIDDLLFKYYNQPDQTKLSDEKIADIYEALIGYCLMEEKLVNNKISKKKKENIKKYLMLIDIYQQ